MWFRALIEISSAQSTAVELKPFQTCQLISGQTPPSILRCNSGNEPRVRLSPEHTPQVLWDLRVTKSRIWDALQEQSYSEFISLVAKRNLQRYPKFATLRLEL